MYLDQNSHRQINSYRVHCIHVYDWKLTFYAGENSAAPTPKMSLPIHIHHNTPKVLSSNLIQYNFKWNTWFLCDFSVYNLFFQNMKIISKCIKTKHTFSNKSIRPAIFTSNQHIHNICFLTYGWYSGCEKEDFEIHFLLQQSEIWLPKKKETWERVFLFAE